MNREHETMEYMGLLTFEEYAAVEHDIPYLYTLERDNKTLFYFGSRHTSDPDDEMFGAIRDALKSFEPEIVMVEGARMLNSDNSRETLETLGSLGERDVIRKFGESMFAAREAFLGGYLVESPEPELAEEIRYITGRGFAEDEVALYYMCSILYHWFRIREKPDINAYIGMGLDFLRRNHAWSTADLSAGAFEKKHETVLGTGVERDDAAFYLRLIDPVPWRDRADDQTVVNEIARLSNRYRDAYMVERIRALLRDYNRLLVVFGATHAYMQRPALERLFGPSRAG
jgi:hypothetical protein